MRIAERISMVLGALLLLFSGLIAFLGVRTADPRTSKGWTRLADMPGPRGEVATAVGARVDDDPNPVRMFVIGGLAGLGRSVATVSVFEPLEQAWTEGPALPAVRHHPAAAGLGGTVYVTGGAVSAMNWRPERNLWILQPAANTWEEGPPMPEGRMAHQMIASDQNLYVIGGRGTTSNVLIFDTVARTWSTGAQMPGKRDHLAAAARDTKIYAIGGRDDDLVRRVDVYDTLADLWTEGPALPIGMSGMAAGTLADGIHVIGGEDPKIVGGTVLDEHFVLTGTGRWERAPLPIVATHGAARAVLNDRLIVAGGARRQGSLSPLGWSGLTQSYAPAS